MSTTTPFFARLHVRWITLLALSALLLAGCAAMPSSQDETATLMKEGQELYAAKRYDEAIVKFRAVTARAPANWGAWLWTARAFIAKGGWAEAIASARKAFETGPGPETLPVFLEALFGGGSQALASGNFPESIKNFSEFLRHNSSNPSAWLNVGKAYLGNKQFAEALQALIGALGAPGVDRNEVIKTILGGGVQAFNQKDYRSAIALLREYIKLDQRNLQAYLTLAKSYWESGERGSALDAFRDVLRVNPTNPDALQFLKQMM